MCIDAACAVQACVDRRLLAVSIWGIGTYGAALRSSHQCCVMQLYILNTAAMIGRLVCRNEMNVSYYVAGSFEVDCIP